MKKALLVACFVAILTSCGYIDNNTDEYKPTMGEVNTTTTTKDNSTKETSSIIFPFENDEDSIPEKSKVISKLTDEEISNLNTKKCGYGQGLRLDDNNRPYCALDFNAEFEKYDSYAIKNEENVVYLTFDQGYENGYTGKILDVLKENNVKATFFILQDYAKKNPELVQRMIDEGHTLANHSVHHYSMPTLEIDVAKKEINDFHEYMKKEFNYEMDMFRPPMGEYSEKSLAITQACGYKTVLWSYAYADWDPAKQMEPSKALEKVTNAAHSGCIYLLHSVSKTNAEILNDVILNLKEKGYSFGIPE